MSPTRRRGAAISIAAALTLLSTAVVPAFDQLAAADGPDLSVCPWMDTTLTADQRAQLLLDKSSRYQKYRWLVEQPANLPEQTSWAGGVEYPAQLPCTPTVYYTDGPEGVRQSEDVTTFPAQIALAATWNEAMAYDKGVAMADEAFGKRRNVILAPGMAGGRTPLSGRTPEYLGEDPVLGGALGGAQASGIESSGRVMSNLKHYVANEQEADRSNSSSNIDERTLVEYYSLPFEIAVREGQPESIMCSYNQINGTYACENEILTTILRDVMDFDGFVMSDFGAVHSTGQSVAAGMDLELNRPVFLTPTRLQAAIESGKVTEQQIDLAARRVVRSYIRAGLFDNPLPEVAVADVSTPEHEALAQTMAEQGSVLLSNNDGALPLTAGLDIALIGATASTTGANGISAADTCGMSIDAPWGTFTPMPCEDVISIEDSLRDRVEEQGGTLSWLDGSDVEAAVTAAEQADVAIVVGYRRMGEFQDLADLTLEDGGDALISEIAEAQPNTVAVLQTGSATTMPWLDKVAAVLQTWYPGEAQGPATVNLLFGDVNPSGKLPMTFPRSLDDTPTATEERYPGIVDASGVRQVNYTEGLKVGYRWYEAENIDPLFAFGHGLSYTSFEYSKVNVTPKNSDGSKAIRISFRITNTGKVAGTDVAQAYVELPESADLPSQRLVGWERVTLKPGQHKNVTIELTRDDLSNRHLLQVWDVESDGWVTPTGKVTFRVGGASDDLSQPVSMTVR